MRLSFYKYHGAGNDFILIDNRLSQPLSYSIELIKYLCHRRYGIGADGLILLQAHPGYDFEMVYYNADGSQSLCGNGSRCAVHLAQNLGIIQDSATFVTIDGPHEAFMEDGTIHIKMHDVQTIAPLPEGYFVYTGSPHYVVFTQDVETVNVQDQGSFLSRSGRFQKEGINVNFVSFSQAGELYVRTYERGVEAETFACGTGAVAVALVAAYRRQAISPVVIRMPGGTLRVTFDKEEGNIFRNIYLSGPATMVFKGEIQIHS